MKKILVTGASGWIGRHCVPLLASNGYEVHAVARRQPPELAPTKIRWHQADLLAPGIVTELMRQVHPDGLLHLAWYAEPGKFWEAGENLEWVRASLELFSAFADSGGNRIVAAGTCAEYARNAGECFENSTPLLPDTLYGASKHDVERFLHLFGPKNSLSSAWGRIFFLYGPREHPSRLVAYVVNSLLRQEPALCSEGKQVLDFMHVEDVASAFVALLEREVQGPVNIASGRPVAVRDVLQEIGRQLGRTESIQFGARKPGSGPESLWANVERLQREVQWVPHYDLAGGIKQTIEWWRNSAGIPVSNPVQKAGI